MNPSINNVNRSLFLASKSPRRRELLQQIGVPFALIDVDVPEERQTQESPQDYVLRLARSKASAALPLLPPSACALGADTIVVAQGQVLEKPRDANHGAAMLKLLSAAEHQVYTSIAIADARSCESQVCCTRVFFRAIDEPEARRYWLTGEPLDKAGGYAIQGFGAVFVARIDGSYSNVVGLPLYETQQLLQRFDLGLWQVTAVHE